MRLLLFLAFAFPGTANAAEPTPASSPVAVILGIAQDAGVPQLNCRCDRCQRARASGREHHAASMALLDPAAQATYLIEATPQVVAQLARLAEDPLLPLSPGRTPLAGILLTHAHVGHYAGLIHFGREAMSASDLPVYATARMSAFLADNAPWSQLVRTAQICVRPIASGRPFELSPRLRVTPLTVPHRDEFSDTVAFIVEGPSKSLLWLPDIDKWERWSTRLEDILDRVDYAFVDATFYSAAELPDRDLADIPHPTVVETAARLGRTRAERRAAVYLIHLNHSNPLLDEPMAAQHRDVLAAAGLAVAEAGSRFEL